MNLKINWQKFKNNYIIQYIIFFIFWIYLFIGYIVYTKPIFNSHSWFVQTTMILILVVIMLLPGLIAWYYIEKHQKGNNNE